MEGGRGGGREGGMEGWGEEGEGGGGWMEANYYSLGFLLLLLFFLFCF